MESKETRMEALDQALLKIESRVRDGVEWECDPAMHRSLTAAKRLEAELAGMIPTRGTTCIVHSDDEPEGA